MTIEKNEARHESGEKRLPTHYTGAMFSQLSRIDRAHSKEEMEREVYSLLSLIGEAMCADRVFLFDCIDAEENIYSNTYEWCA